MQPRQGRHRKDKKTMKRKVRQFLAVVVMQAALQLVDKLIVGEHLENPFKRGSLNWFRWEEQF
jgi:hypothetical protein